MNSLTGSDPLQLADHLLKGCSVSLSLLAKRLNEVSNLDGEVTDHRLAEARKYVIEHLA